MRHDHSYVLLFVLYFHRSYRSYQCYAGLVVFKLTVDRLDKAKGASGVGLVVLSHPNVQLIVGVSTVVMEELQTLVATIRVEHPTFQVRIITRRARNSAEVHEIATVCESVKCQFQSTDGFQD